MIILSYAAQCALRVWCMRCVWFCVCWLDGCGVSYLYKQTLCSVSDKGLAAQWQKRDGVSELQATKLQLTPRERERNKDLRKRNNLGKFRITSRQSNKKKKRRKKSEKETNPKSNICKHLCQLDFKKLSLHYQSFKSYRLD